MRWDRVHFWTELRFSAGELSSVLYSSTLGKDKPWYNPVSLHEQYIWRVCYCLRGYKFVRARNTESLLWISRQLIKYYTLWAFDSYLLFASLLPHESLRFHHLGTQFYPATPLPSSALGNKECVFPHMALFNLMCSFEHLETMVTGAIEIERAGR